MGATHEALVSTDVQEWAKAARRRLAGRVQPLRGGRPKALRKALVVHLDGVPRAVLDQAVARGAMPFLSRLVRTGAYALDSAFWGSPASTPCFQAGLLYGLRHPNLPAYHWFDRELNRVVRMNVPQDALAIEGRLKAYGRNTLLEGGGTTYLSLFRADASNLLCMTALADVRRASCGLARELGTLSPARRQSSGSFLRALAQDTLDTARDVSRWVRGLHGDLRHEREYQLNRFFMIDLAWNLAHSQSLVDMAKGVPLIYLVFGNYDEVAHRRGPRSRQALDQLVRVDHQLEELYGFSQALEVPYDVLFVTDHGHVDSAPIEQRIGQKVERYLLGGAPAVVSGDLERGLLDGRPPLFESPVQVREEPVVIEAGNFAHVYLTRGRKPLEARELLARHRDVLGRVAAQRDIGITALRRGSAAVAIIRGGVYGPREIASAPLEWEFSRRAVADLLDELPHMPTAGDLVLFGEVCQPGGTVGFAWEFGSHGGVTRTETDSVVLWPARFPVDLSGLSHATRLHEKLSEVYRQ